MKNRSIYPQSQDFVTSLTESPQNHLTNYSEVVPSTSFIGNLTFDLNGTLCNVGFNQATNQDTILRYDELTGAPLPSAGNSSAIYVPTNKALKRPIGITALLNASMNFLPHEVGRSPHQPFSPERREPEILSPLLLVVYTQVLIASFESASAP